MNIPLPEVPVILTTESRIDSFPEVDDALETPNGLLAVGGDLSSERLVYAYKHGIFPWYNDGQPILWWSPHPRYVIYPETLHISRSLHKVLNRRTFRVTWNQKFTEVVERCAAPRRSSSATWITTEMQAAYERLHLLGQASSVECWHGDRLVGGLYGVDIGAIFFGESMFSIMANASKVALVNVCMSGYKLVDCQLPNEHLLTMGATPITRKQFMSEVTEGISLKRLVK